MTTPDSSHLTSFVPGASSAIGPGLAVAQAHTDIPLDQYSFFQALRQIERQRPSQPRIGYAQRPVDEPVRIGQPAELTFAPTSLVGRSAIATQATSQATTIKQGRADAPPVQVQQRFLGLLGPTGPMPLHITETVRDRVRHANDDSLQAFLDIFHHRIATLFYRAWSDAQPAVQHDRPQDDRFAKFVGALVGSIGRQQRPAGLDELDRLKRYLAGHFLGTHRHAEGLASVLAYALQAPARVQPFALRTLVLADEDRSKLCSRPRSRVSQRTNCLGLSAQLGATVLDRTSMIDVQIGPVGYKTFEQFLPGGTARVRLSNALRHYAGAAIDARVTIQLQSAEVPRTALGQAGQLGRSAWIAGSNIQSDRHDYRFDVCGASSPGDPSREAAA